MENFSQKPMLKSWLPLFLYDLDICLQAFVLSPVINMDMVKIIHRVWETLDEIKY